MLHVTYSVDLLLSNLDFPPGPREPGAHGPLAPPSRPLPVLSSWRTRGPLPAYRRAPWFPRRTPAPRLPGLRFLFRSVVHGSGSNMETNSPSLATALADTFIAAGISQTRDTPSLSRLPSTCFREASRGDPSL
uniref:Uncharacterized protein n=1 Tax=Rousettus aegyptiacus TaxID=9407 RepID=A0A7J8DIC4_ROUAE|nr:hypothetical protein HJG63_008724 [Rousettus aegyptiacus]